MVLALELTTGVLVDLAEPRLLVGVRRAPRRGGGARLEGSERAARRHAGAAYAPLCKHFAGAGGELESGTGGELVVGVVAGAKGGDKASGTSSRV